MRASAIEFRLRVVIIVIAICLGFWSPWVEAWGPRIEFAGRVSLLEWLALELSRLGLVSFTVATPVVIVAGALVAAIAAALRIWGTAYLGPGTVNNAQMKAGTVMASGPYRYVRNPLYLGSFGMIAAICFLMPPTGAVFVLMIVGVFLTLAVFSWTYNNELMIRAILVSFGVSLVVRALVPSIRQEAGSPE